ncbi:MAG: outer membrane beta-barrel protein [Cyclobacteriaceae bacterium]|nr:outer membrane beta-barrel protein [Cyclobacteriaceae bacterium]
MKKHIFASTLSLLLLMSFTANSQVLISLLFGDALNSDKVEFGLTGGGNRSYIRTISDANGVNYFNLGFYFHINIEGSSYLSTGVQVKSSTGASGMATYPVGEDDIDNVFADGELTKKINYFYVPIMWHQRFNNRWFLEGGFQLGLRNKSKDIFTTDYNDDELTYTIDARDQYKRLDAGLIGGVGYKWKKELKSVSSGLNYYHGLMNVSNVDGVTVKNSGFYLYVRLPIGAGGNKKDTSAGDAG